MKKKKNFVSNDVGRGRKGRTKKNKWRVERQVSMASMSGLCVCVWESMHVCVNPNGERWGWWPRSESDEDHRNGNLCQQMGTLWCLDALAHLVCRRHTRTHILHPWWDTISTLLHSLFLCLPSAHTHTHSRQPSSPTPQVCLSVSVCVCAAIISNHISVFSLGVCELPPPGRPICVVVAVMVIASWILSCLQPLLLWCRLFTRWGQTMTLRHR